MPSMLPRMIAIGVACLVVAASVTAFAQRDTKNPKRKTSVEAVAEGATERRHRLARITLTAELTRGANDFQNTAPPSCGLGRRHRVGVDLDCGSMRPAERNQAAYRSPRSAPALQVWGPLTQQAPGIRECHGADSAGSRRRGRAVTVTGVWGPGARTGD